jgi:hypothetical protein
VHGRWTALVAGLLFVLGAFVLYLWSNPERLNFYNHFVWQADAFLAGRVWIPFPVEASGSLPGNAYFNDVYPLVDEAGSFTGQVLIPFPPLPALVLLPFVAVAGLAADQELVAIVLAAIGVGLAWWMLGRIPVSRGVRALVTVFFATGTVWWWSAAVGSTWYLAHLIAVNLTFLAVGVALGRDPGASDVDDVGDDPRDADPGEAPVEGRPAASGGSGLAGRIRTLMADTLPLDRSQVLVGLLLGLAATARLPLVFAAPFFMLVGSGGTWQRRTVSAGVGGFIPVATLLLYTYLTTGAFLHPGYDYQYQLEANGYPTLGYNPEWAVEDLRYVPQNIGIMFGALPAILPDFLPNTLRYSADVPVCVDPDAVRGLFDVSCPIAVPRDIGTSILLTSPAFLLVAFPLLRHRWSRLVLGSVLATVALALFNLAHFSQGWVQWGYRFSNDFIPFLLPLVALGAGVGGRAGGRPRVIAVVLVAVSAVVNLWGIVWGGILGW